MYYFLWYNYFMERHIEFNIDEFYHIYQRGNNRGAIFKDDRDRNHFIKLLFLCNSKRSVVFRDIPIGGTYVFERGEPLADIGCYCLMPNHFHLLLHESRENGITDFMRKLNTAYVMYFNKRHARTGKLFEGVFRAEHADTDEYLKYLFAYIHLNPVKFLEPEWKEKGLRDQVATRVFLEKYFYSSYNDYAASDDREEAKILNRAAFPGYFQDTKEFKDHLNDWLNYNPSII